MVVVAVLMVVEMEVVVVDVVVDVEVDEEVDVEVVVVIEHEALDLLNKRVLPLSYIPSLLMSSL